MWPRIDRSLIQKPGSRRLIKGTLHAALCLTALLVDPTAPAAAGTLGIPFTLTKPAGDGPFPAVVILHDCSGLGPRSSGAPWRWSSELTAWGFVTIWPDSFSTRGRPRRLHDRIRTAGALAGARKRCLRGARPSAH